MRMSSQGLKYAGQQINNVFAASKQNIKPTTKKSNSQKHAVMVKNQGYTRNGAPMIHMQSNYTAAINHNLNDKLISGP